MRNNRYTASCYHCCYKHLGQAAVLYEESLDGYPLHIHLCKGHLAEAASEVMKDNIELAQVIRHVRLEMDAGNSPDFLYLLEQVENAEKDKKATHRQEPSN